MRTVCAEDLARERVWLEALEAGEVTRLDLARIAGLSRSQINKRLARAEEERDRERSGPPEPHLNFLLPVTPCMPMRHASCADVHPDGPIQGNDCCSVCNKSGIDYLWVGTRHAPKVRINRKYSPDSALKGGTS